MNGWLAVANAYSGGRGGKRAGIENAMAALGGAIDDAVFSEYPGHARSLASSAAGYEGIVAIGGDGTLLEVLNGIDRRRQRLAILPLGRGNSLARDLGLCDGHAAADALTAGAEQTIDLARVNMIDERGVEMEILSASTIAVGYPVAATILASRMKSLGRFCYAAAAALSSIRMEAAEIEVGYDDEPLRRRSLRGLIVSNTRHLANFIAFPDADCADGLLDVMEMDAGALRQNVRNLSALCAIDLCAPASVRKARRLRARFSMPSQIMIDGEVLEDISELKIEIVRGGLRCQRPMNS